MDRHISVLPVLPPCSSPHLSHFATCLLPTCSLAASTKETTICNLPTGINASVLFQPPPHHKARLQTSLSLCPVLFHTAALPNFGFPSASFYLLTSPITPSTPVSLRSQKPSSMNFLPSNSLSLHCWERGPSFWPRRIPTREDPIPSCPTGSWRCQSFLPSPESLTSAPSPPVTRCHLQHPTAATTSFRRPCFLLSFPAPKLLGVHLLSVSASLLPFTPHPSEVWPRLPLTTCPPCPTRSLETSMSPYQGCPPVLI